MPGVPARLRNRRGILAAGAALILVAVLVRITVAPLALPAAGLAESMLPVPAGGAVEVGGVTVRLGAGVVHLALRDVRLRATGLSASVPHVRVRQGLFGRELEVEEPLVRVDPVVLAGSGDRGAAAPNPARALEALDAALAQAGAVLDQRGVRSVELGGGRLEVVPSGRPITASRVFRDVRARIVGGADPALALSLLGAAGTVEASLSRAATEEGSRVRIAVSGLVPHDLAHLRIVDSGFPLDAELEAGFLPGGEVDEASALVRIGKGVMVFGVDPPLTLDAGRIALSLAPSGTILLDEAEFVAGGTRVPWTGALSPGAGPDAPWTFTLASYGALFEAPDLDEPSAVVDIGLAGRIDLARSHLHVDRLAIEMDDGRADAVLMFDWSDGPRLSGSARLGPSVIGTLRAVWPPLVAYGPRMAVLETVLGGFVEEVTVDLALTPLELDGDPATHDMIDGGLTLDAAMREATLTGAGLPIAVRRAHGAVAIRDKVLSARIDGGVIGADGHDLTLVGATFEIADLQTRPAVATIRATVEGPLAAVVAIAERVELPQLEAFEVTPGDVTGTVRAELWIETPLSDSVPRERRRWSIDGRLTDAGAGVPINGRMVERANLEVLLNSRRIAARGRAVIDGLSLDVNYSELFEGERSGAARFVLTDGERRQRGFDTGRMLRGPVVVTVEEGGDARRSFIADFTEAEVALPVFEKAAGRALLAEGAIVGDEAAMQLEGVRLEGAGAELEGALEVADGALAWAAFDTVAFSPGDSARLNVERTESGGYRLDLDAERLDARRLARSLVEGGREPRRDGGAVMPSLALVARAAQLRLSDDAVAGDVMVDAFHDGARLQRLSLSGRLDGVAEGSFAARVAPGANGSRDVFAEVRELGRLLAAFDIYERMEGGRTTMEARLDQDGVLTGRVLVRDLALANERSLDAVIARARSVGRGADDGRNPLPLAFQGADGGLAIPFERLQIDFEKRGDIVRISEAILRGSVMGGTVEGTVDLAARTVSLNGTFIPAYGVNNLFGRLPLFGEILGGGEKGGLIGVTFRLAGPIDDPQLLLNPISAIAPGIFRRIFEFR